MLGDFILTQMLGLSRSDIPQLKGIAVTHPAIAVGQLYQGTVEALDYAHSIGDEVVAIHVNIGSTDREKLQKRWQELESDIAFVVLDSEVTSLQKKQQL